MYIHIYIHMYLCIRRTVVFSEIYLQFGCKRLRYNVEPRYVFWVRCRQVQRHCWKFSLHAMPTRHISLGNLCHRDHCVSVVSCIFNCLCGERCADSLHVKVQLGGQQRRHVHYMCCGQVQRYCWESSVHLMSSRHICRGEWTLVFCDVTFKRNSGASCLFLPLQSFIWSLFKTSPFLRVMSYNTPTISPLYFLKSSDTWMHLYTNLSICVSPILAILASLTKPAVLRWLESKSKLTW